RAGTAEGQADHPRYVAANPRRCRGRRRRWRWRRRWKRRRWRWRRRRRWRWRRRWWRRWRRTARPVKPEDLVGVAWVEVAVSAPSERRAVGSEAVARVPEDRAGIRRHRPRHPAPLSQGIEVQV